MDTETSALIDTAKKLALLTDALERRSQAAMQAQEQAGQVLGQTVNMVRHDVSQLVQGSGQQIAQLVQQGMDSALTQGTAKFGQAVSATTAKLDEASRAIVETLNATTAHARHRIWTAYAAVLGAVLLLVVGGGIVLWLQWQSYNDLHARIAAAQIDVDTAEAYARTGVTSCGGQPCIKLDEKSQRWGSKGEYVLLDSTVKSKK